MQCCLIVIINLATVLLAGQQAGLLFERQTRYANTSKEARHLPADFQAATLSRNK